MKISGRLGENDGEVAVIKVIDGSGAEQSHFFDRLEGSAYDFRAAFPEGATIAIKHEWLQYSKADFSTAMAVLQKLRNGAGYSPGQQQQITVPVPGALHARLNEWNAKRQATAVRLQQLPRSLRYDFLRSEGIPAAVAKGLRDKPAHIDALPIQGNKGAEVQVTSLGIRVPVLDRQAVIPVEWPAIVAIVTRISFAQQSGEWSVTINWLARGEPPAGQPVAVAAVTQAA